MSGSSPHQRADLAGRIEYWGWHLSLALFFVAAVVLITMILLQAGLWLLLPLGIMIASNVHLDAFRDALRHGEILLMVDTPQDRVNEVEHGVQRHHPEAVAAGSSRNMPVPGT